MKYLRLLLTLSTFLIAAGAAPLPDISSRERVSSDLSPSRANENDGRLRVIIQWTAGTTGGSEKIVSLGGTVVSELKLIYGGTYIVPALAIDVLSHDPSVKYISIDRKVHRKLANATAAINAPAAWKAGYVGSGIGVAIVDSGINPDANLPQIAYAEDFTTNSIGSSPGSASSGAGSKNTAPDWYGHGQHIAGIVASNANDSKCSSCTSLLLGVAPGVSLINLRVLDGLGEGDESKVIAAIDRAVQLKSKYNIRILNLSLGGPVLESYVNDPLCQAAEAAWKAGIVVVVAAGNEGRENSFGNAGYGTILSPGNDPYVITVGAMKSMGTPEASDDLIASYSSKGPALVDHVVKPDIVAPGNMVISLRARYSRLPLLMPENIPLLSSYQTFSGFSKMILQMAPPTDATRQPVDARIGKGYSSTYFTLSGTSMAAAAVSGAVADLLQANASLTPDQIKMLLMKTANKTFPDLSSVVDPDTGVTYTSFYDIFTVGAGYLDLQAALADVNNVPAGLTALSPTATFDANTGDVTLAFDSSSVFSGRSKWGTDTVDSQRVKWGASGTWGTSVIDSHRALWGSRSMWGSGTVDSQRTKWGSSGIWDSRSMWGTGTAKQSESVVVKGEN